HVLFTVRTAYLTESASEFRNQIMLAPVATPIATPISNDEALPLTFGEAASQPRWSPDGRTIAFLRKMPDTNDYVGLWVMRASGGEAWPLTGASNGIRNDITNFKWSPEGRRLAVVC